MLATKSVTFNELLLHAIDEALASLGDSVMQSTYFHIENKCRVARNKIPENLQEFQGGLKEIFGAGAQFIESLIVKNLQIIIGPQGATVKSEQLGFIECLDAAKQGYLGNAANQTFVSQSRAFSPFPVFTVSASKL